MSTNNNTGANGKKPTSPVIWVLAGLIVVLLVVLVVYLVKDSSTAHNYSGGTAYSVSTPTPEPTPAPTPKPSPVSRSSDGIDYYTEDQSYTKRFGVRVAHTRKLDGSKIIVENLRAAGYNAFVYEIPGKSGYGIVVGVFDNKDDADKFASYLHQQSYISDADLANAYTSNVYLSNSAARKYSNRRW